MAKWQELLSGEGSSVLRQAFFDRLPSMNSGQADRWFDRAHHKQGGGTSGLAPARCLCRQ
jgi:hypothetical protein